MSRVTMFYQLMEIGSGMLSAFLQLINTAALESIKTNAVVFKKKTRPKTMINKNEANIKVTLTMRVYTHLGCKGCTEI